MSSVGTFARGAKNKREDGDGERNSKEFLGASSEKTSPNWNFFYRMFCFTFCAMILLAFRPNSCRYRESSKFTCFRRRFTLSTSGLSRSYVNTWKSSKINMQSLSGLRDDSDNAKQANSADLSRVKEINWVRRANKISPWKFCFNLIRPRSSVPLIRPQSVITVNVLAKWLIGD